MGACPALVQCVYHSGRLVFVFARVSGPFPYRLLLYIHIYMSALTYRADLLCSCHAISDTATACATVGATVTAVEVFYGRLLNVRYFTAGCCLRTEHALARRGLAVPSPSRRRVARGGSAPRSEPS